MTVTMAVLRPAALGRAYPTRRMSIKASIRGRGEVCPLKGLSAPVKHLNQKRVLCIESTLRDFDLEKLIFAKILIQRSFSDKRY